MKAGIKFILTYYALSILFLFISGWFVKGLAGEEMSYLLWFYIYNVVLGVIIFPVSLLMIRRLSIGNLWKAGICFLIILVLLNVVPYFAGDGQLLTAEALRELFGTSREGLNFNTHPVVNYVFSASGVIN